MPKVNAGIVAKVSHLKLFEHGVLKVGRKTFDPIMFDRYQTKVKYWWKRRIKGSGTLSFSSKTFGSLVTAQRDFLQKWVMNDQP